MKIKNVFTVNYGFARSLLAFGTLITLLFTNPHDYFTDSFFKTEGAKNSLVTNFFYILGEQYLYVSVALAIIILLWVISGYLPQVSGILHAWVTASIFSGSLIVEGGDQIAQILTILLIPITIFDKRINHWFREDYFTYNRHPAIAYFCFTVLVIIQIQMSVLYLFAGTEKLGGNEWADGSAIYYWINNSAFGAPAYLKFVLNPLITNPYITPLITWGVIALELLLFAAIFMNPHAKKIVFTFAIMFHFMIFLVHGLAAFFFAMAGGLVLYLLPADWLDLKPISFWKWQLTTE